MGIIWLCGSSQGTALIPQSDLNVDLYVVSVKPKHIKHGLGFLYKILQIEEERERDGISRSQRKDLIDG